VLSPLVRPLCSSLALALRSVSGRHVNYYAHTASFPLTLRHSYTRRSNDAITIHRHGDRRLSLRSRWATSALFIRRPTNAAWDHHVRCPCLPLSPTANHSLHHNRGPATTDTCHEHDRQADNLSRPNTTPLGAAWAPRLRRYVGSVSGRLRPLSRDDRSWHSYDRATIAPTITSTSALAC
jgi:hypothetical protein